MGLGLNFCDDLTSAGFQCKMSEKSIPVMKPNSSELKRGKGKKGVILDLVKKEYLELMFC